MSFKCWILWLLFAFCLLLSSTLAFPFVSFLSSPSPFVSLSFLSSSVVSSEDIHQSHEDQSREDDLPGDFPRREDVFVAIEAVRKACSVTQRLQPVYPSSSSSFGDTEEAIQQEEKVRGAMMITKTTVTKTDSSPVTIADFAAQALVLNHLHSTYNKEESNDSFIAEESSEPLQSDPNLAQSIFNVTSNSFDTIDQLMESIDLGKSYLSWDRKDGGNGGGGEGTGRPRRVWCLDPIDGTKGFLRGKREGGQYAVALALLEDGIPTIGVLGCPNLPVSFKEDSNYAWSESETENNYQESRGCLFVASRGGGCFQLPLYQENSSVGSKRVRVTPNDGSTMTIEDARFCIGVEKGIADALGQCDNMAKILHGEEHALNENGDIVKAQRIDSMAKYAVLARGDAEFYVRLPKPDYVENIWDHAAGCVVLQEAGGKLTDAYGDAIDFSLGAKLSKDVRGILGSSGGIFHEALVRSYREQQQQQQQQQQ